MSRKLLVVLCASTIHLGFGCQQSAPTERQSPEELGRELLVAVKMERVPEVKLLLERGANPNTTEMHTHDNDTALTLACKSGNKEIVDILLAKGADPNRRQGDAAWTLTPLIIAAASGQVDIAKKLLNAGANPEDREGLLHDREGGADIRPSSALTHAAQEGHAELVRLLLLAGARIERTDLWVAVIRGHVNVVRLMLRSDADPRWTFRDGKSVLQTAEMSPKASRAEMVKTVRHFLSTSAAHPK